MKVYSILLTAFFAVSLAAGEPLWNGEATGVRIVSKLAEQKFAVRDGAVTATAVSNHPKYSYLTFNVEVKPFSFAKQGLTFEISVDQPLPGDSFYVKGLAADGKCAISFYTFKIPAAGTRLTLLPGKLPDGFNVLGNDLKAAPDAAVVKLQFFLGRKTPEKPMSITISKIETVENIKP